MSVRVYIQTISAQVILLVFWGQIMSFLTENDSSGPSHEDCTQEVAGFVAKTFQILNEPDFAKIVYWSSNGAEFTIKDVIKFEEIVLPKFFRHNKMNSFVRQLNMYGFHKTKHNHFKSTFKHPKFQKDREEQLHLVKRKLKGSHENQENQENEPPRNGAQLSKPVTDKPTAKPGSPLKKEPELTSTEIDRGLGLGNEFMGTTKMINYSLKKVSFNDFNSLGQLDEEPREDCVSIEDELDLFERKDSLDHGIGDFFDFQNPSCFFNSRFDF